MPQKRIKIEGGVYFVTSRTFENREIFVNESACKLFIEVLDYCREKLNFTLYAFAVLIDHIHLLISPSERNTISDVVRHLKGRFAKRYNELINNSKLNAEDKFLSCEKGILYPAGEEFILAGKPIWQKSFYDRVIRTEKQMENTIKYIDFNAVKHGLADNPEKWLYSSYHNHNQTGKELIEIDYLT